MIAAVFACQGCGEHDELPEMTKQAVKFDDVPENVRTAATKAIPGVNFSEAWKNLATGESFTPMRSAAKTQPTARPGRSAFALR